MTLIQKVSSISLAVLLMLSAATIIKLNIAQPALATFSGVNGRIVFESDRDGNSEIYVMNDDGSGQTRLTNNSGIDAEPRWSSDGAKIVFVRDGQIYVMNADGSGQTNVSNNSFNDASPSWSPDGTRIVFTRDNQLYVMNANGSGQTKLFGNSESWIQSPDWSPDGTRIVFRGGGQCCQDSEINLINTDGSGHVEVILDFSGTLFVPGPPFIWMNWSPNGTKLAFTADYGGANVYTVNINGIDLQNLTRDGSGFSYWDLHPSWSPDGTKIVFENGNGPFDEFDHEIHVMNADGSGQTRLTFNDARDGSPDWGVFPNVTPPLESKLTIKSVDSKWEPITGLWTTIRTTDGTLVKSGYTPLTFVGKTGTDYKVTVANYDGKEFARWQDNGSTSRTRTISLSSDITLTAVYNVSPALRGFTSLTYTGTAEQPDLTVNALAIDGNKTCICGSLLTLRQRLPPALRTKYMPATTRTGFLTIGTMVALRELEL